MAGLLGAFRQYIRDAMPGGALNPEVTRQGLLDAGAIATTPVPFLGDAVGLLADANRYINEPESRTPMNFGLSALGALPFVPHMGMAGIFAGQGAKTADLVKLEKAKSLDASGVPNKEIWQQTGWFKGPEGKWKFEIDDSKAALIKKTWEQRGPAPGYAPNETMINGAMRHGELFKSYPEMKDSDYLARSFYGDGKAQFLQGSYEPDVAGTGLNKIEIQAPTAESMKSGLLHELQHSVQRREGFARGGNPREMQGMVDTRDALESINRQLTDLNKQSGVADWIAENWKSRAANENLTEMKDRFYRDVAPKYYQDWRRLREQIDGILQDWPELAWGGGKGDAEALYRRLAGEAEARAVQSRMNMTPQQRGLLFPLDSYDVPLSQLIFR